MIPSDIRAIYETKLGDTSRFREEETDPTSQLQEEMRSLLKTGVLNKFIPADHARKTLGINLRPDGSFTLSTDDRFKPECSYAYPLLKVHKLSQAELKEKKIPPTRFITDLSRGLSHRHDKYLAWMWLTPLMNHYCGDILKDTTHALQVLEEVSNNRVVQVDMLTFSIDVVSLYDNIRPDLALEALDAAMLRCRPEWGNNFKIWLRDCIRHSLKSAVIHHQNKIYFPTTLYSHCISHLGIHTGSNILRGNKAANSAFSF